MMVFLQSVEGAEIIGSICRTHFLLATVDHQLTYYNYLHLASNWIADVCGCCPRSFLQTLYTPCYEISFSIDQAGKS